MESKVERLVDQIYQSGIEKADKEAEQIIQNAKDKAAGIEADARQKAENIIKDAESSADQLKKNTEAEMKLAATQALSRLRQQIKELIQTKTLGTPVAQASLDAAFLKELILKIAGSWKGSEIVLTIPEAKKQDLEAAIRSSIEKELAGLEIKTTQGAGFTVQKKDEGFELDFTDEALMAFFGTFVKEETGRYLESAGS